MAKKFSKNVKVVIDILEDEVKGNVQSALRKLTKDYTMTWMYKGKEKLFPKTGKKLKDEWEDKEGTALLRPTFVLYES